MRRNLQLRASELFERYGAVVFRRCRKLLGTDERAHDAVQDVFVKVLEHGHAFRGDSEPLTWLYRVATTHCLQRLRDERRRQTRLELELEPGAPGPTASSVEDRLTLTRILEAVDPGFRSSPVSATSMGAPWKMCAR